MLYSFMQGLTIYLAVHLDQIISSPLLVYIVEVEPPMSANVKHTLKLVITAIIRKLLEFFVKVTFSDSCRYIADYCIYSIYIPLLRCC